MKTLCVVMEQDPKVHTEREPQTSHSRRSRETRCASITQRIPGRQLVDLTVAAATTLDFLDSPVLPVLLGVSSSPVTLG